MTSSKMKSRITVITVNYNDAFGLQKTLESLHSQNYKSWDHIIIDAASTDSSLSVIKKNAKFISKWVSEKDQGIYDGMNKGIAFAKTDWIILMNSGDIFYDSSSLNEAAKLISDDVSVIYTDTIVRRAYDRYIICNHETMRIVHQSILYRKSLHKKYGNYFVKTPIINSDFIFLNLCRNEVWQKSSHPLSIVEGYGLSSSIKSFYQKHAISFLFGDDSSIKLASILLLYPLYRFIKKPFVLLKNILKL